jgi:hypothetical protein
MTEREFKEKLHALLTQAHQEAGLSTDTMCVILIRECAMIPEMLWLTFGITTAFATVVAIASVILSGGTLPS